MYTGGWEVVGRNKKDKVTSKAGGKLSKAEKKKFIENAPKVEDFREFPPVPARSPVGLAKGRTLCTVLFVSCRCFSSFYLINLTSCKCTFHRALFFFLFITFLSLSRCFLSTVTKFKILQSCASLLQCWFVKLATPRKISTISQDFVFMD